MISKQHFFLYLIFSVFISCSSESDDSIPVVNDSIPLINEKPDSLEHLKLLFQTGFEGNLSFIPWGENNKIVGYTPDLDKSDWGKLESRDGVETIFFNYTGGNESQRYAKLVSDPENENNKTLLFCLNDWWEEPVGVTKSRVQLGFHKMTPEVKELFQSVRVYLSDDFNCLKSYPAPVTWCTIGEFWNNTWWENDPYGFRISLGIGKPKADSNKLYFTLNGQNDKMVSIWNADNLNVEVPIGKWFTMKYYFRNGDLDTGRFYMTIQPDGGDIITVFDVYSYTHHTENLNPKGLQGYEPLKLYTSGELMDYVKSQGKSLKIYWDDLKIWRD